MSWAGTSLFLILGLWYMFSHFLHTLKPFTMLCRCLPKKLMWMKPTTRTCYWAKWEKNRLSNDFKSTFLFPDFSRKQVPLREGEKAYSNSFLPLCRRADSGVWVERSPASHLCQKPSLEMTALCFPANCCILKTLTCTRWSLPCGHKLADFHDLHEKHRAW